MGLTPVVINGKFLRAQPTGVHRVAGELITHLDRLLVEEDHDKRDWSLVGPKDALGHLPLTRIERRQAGHFTWQWWEQFELPQIARGAVLVNLCNLAPLAHRRSVTLVHDAQVFISPASYSLAFRTWYQFALPRIGRSAGRLVTISEYSRDRLAEFGVAPRERISVVPDGADHLLGVISEPKILGRLEVKAGSFVLAVANAQAHKNMAVLFKAFASGALEGMTLVLAGGDGPQAFAGAGLQPPREVVFAGHVPDGELRALYEHALCLAFPSTTEGFGLPPMEAMSLGCPVIAAPCGALPEVCGEAALYAAPNAPHAWAETILRLAREPALREATRQAGLARAGRYRWRDSARQLLDIIEEVA